MILLAMGAALATAQIRPNPARGSVLFPGGPPQGRLPGGSILNPGALPVNLGNNVRGVVAPVGHPSHSRRSVVAVPVFVGDYYSPGYEAPMMPQQPQVIVVQSPPPPPVIILNQSYQPERVQEMSGPAMREYFTPTGPNAAAPRTSVYDEQATIYLIAFKDGSVRQAVAYWVDGSTLNYVTPQAKMNRATLDLVDVSTSKRLNDERKVEFSLTQ
jgi:hypothetical protein